ncbi:MAG TPA: FtsK/SpoIIIE domain-containing protein [Actinomycetales bacterium]|nr:FtsK/SpoIIIE domain-containing protein [Actinomycetales bacterium]
MRFTVVDPDRGALRSDVAVTAGPGTSFDELRPLLLEAVGRDPTSAEALFVDGSRLDQGVVIGLPPLVNGAVVTVARPGSEPGRAVGQVGGFLELHVVGGPDSGQVYRLTPGQHRLGRAGEAVLRIDDPDCSRVHAEIDVTAGGVLIRDLGSTNGTWVDGEKVGDSAVALTERSSVLVGSSTLRLRVPEATEAATHERGDGYLDLNRSPRIAPLVDRVEIRLPTAPEQPRAVRVPVVAMVLPVLVAAPLAFFWSPLALLFGLMTPVMMLGNALSDKVSGRRDYRSKLAEYEAARAQAEQRLTEAVTTEALRRRAGAPDNGELLRIATGPLQRIWERRRHDADMLELRVGTATLPSQIAVHDPSSGGEPASPEIDDVPVTVPLDDVGVLGVAGHRERAVALVRSLLGQIATLHSPRDVTLVVLAADSRDRHPDGSARGPMHPGGDWTPAAWLPHTRPDALAAGPAWAGASETCDNLVGLNAEQVQRRVAELNGLLDQRLSSVPTLSARREHGRWSGSRVVVLLDGAQRLRTVPGVSRLLELGPTVGIHFVCLDADPARLPVECRGTVLVAGEVGTRLRVTVAGHERLDGVVADLASARWFERLSRCLAPLRDATPASAGGSVPDEARLLDVMRDEALPDPTDPAAVADAWRSRPRSTAALLGVSVAGPHVVDLRLDGPHALVGGTTGSGKSELLQTLIASLAASNRPDELGFVLVDYKGGSAFADCARLPHTLGLVTDLDEDLTRRALESLTAEVTRRERLLSEHGAKDLDDYQALVDAAAGGVQGAPPRLGRLVLVIDEFRVLAEELPDFLDGLVRIAAVGRSLGIHLVLATQRPGGIVSADIKANVNLRIALRVRDSADSVDVVDVPEAATISERTPGRALSRTGSSPLVEFQTARVGGRGPGGGAPTPVTARRTPWPTLGDPPPRPATARAHAGPTDLAEVVDALRDAATRLGVTPPTSPWLPPLPDLVTTQNLSPGTSGQGNRWAIPFGLLDLPGQQSQVPVMFDLAAGSSLAVAGTARSGRTTLLRTIATTAADRHSPADLAIYAIDSGGGLAALGVLPHSGAVVPVDDTERTSRLLHRLTGEVARRQKLLAVGGLADIGEQRRGAALDTAPSGAGVEPLPYLLLLVDGWEALQQAHEDVDMGKALDLVQQLVRSGPGTGLLTVVAGERGVLTGQLGSSLPLRVVLRLADPTDAVIAGVPPREVPKHMPAGRGHLVRDRSAHLAQVAVLGADVSGATQARAVEEVAHRAARLAGSPPFSVPAMPAAVALDEVAATAEARDGFVPVGLGGDDVSIVGFDLAADGRKLVIAGHPGSGRSTALLTIARGLLSQGFDVAAVAPSPSVLSGLLSERDGEVLGHFGIGDDGKLTALLAGGRESGRPVAVVVDDADQLDGGSYEPVLLGLLDRLPTSRDVLVLAGSTPELVGRYHGVTVSARRGASGLLLGPGGNLDGDVFGVRLPRRIQRHPGRGLLVRRGALTAVQVALPTSETGETSETS